MSNEFKEKSLSVAESLGIQGASALAASGQWGALAEAIIRARDAENEAAIRANNAIINGQNGKSIEGKEQFNGSAHIDLEHKIDRVFPDHKTASRARNAHINSRRNRVRKELESTLGN